MSVHLSRLAALERQQVSSPADSGDIEVTSSVWEWGSGQPGQEGLIPGRLAGNSASPLIFQDIPFVKTQCNTLGGDRDWGVKEVGHLPL